MLGAVAPIGLRLAGTAVPALAAGLGLTMGVPATLANIRGRQTGFNNPTASGVPGALLAGAAGLGPGGLIGSGLSALAYKQGREAGKKKRIENTMYDQAVLDKFPMRPATETIGASIMRDLMQKRMQEQKARMINPVLSGGMATQPQLGTAMGIANQIYGMQQ
mgnify:FL=1|tara:strand:- start:272 stop:760 length:489 start_codon:yes stop_codon:yes gene_type:complete